MNERIRYSGGHWWELLNGTTRFGFATEVDGRRTYGLIVGGKLVCMLLDRWGSYCIGYHLYRPIEENADAMTHSLIKVCPKAKAQTIEEAMQEAEEEYRKYLVEQQDYYAGLLEKYDDAQNGRLNA